MSDFPTPPSPAPQPEDVPNGFLFIGELAKLTGADPKTIRFYERAQLLSPPRHGRFRTFLSSDVQRLRNVLALRRLGVPIAEIKLILDQVEPDADVLSSRTTAAMLTKHLEALRAKQSELVQQIEQTSSALHALVA